VLWLFGVDFADLACAASVVAAAIAVAVAAAVAVLAFGVAFVAAFACFSCAPQKGARILDHIKQMSLSDSPFCYNFLLYMLPSRLVLPFSPFNF
jgi:hypothetical protein